MAENYYVIYSGSESNPIFLTEGRRREVRRTVQGLSDFQVTTLGFKKVPKKDVERVRREINDLSWAKLLGQVDENGRPYLEVGLN